MTHGTNSGYAAHGCRCAECTEAHRLDAAARRSLAEAMPRPLITSQQTHCSRALCDLLDTTRALTERAERLNDHAAHRGLTSIGHTIDATRTRLIQDGDEFLEAAWAFLDAGRRMVADHAMKLDARQLVTHV